MQITIEYLESINACSSGKNWFLSQKETNSLKIIKKLIKEKHLNWASWFICRLFNKTQKVQYAIYAAEQVIKFFENKYPYDKRPRKAIEAAKEYLNNPSAYVVDASYASYASYAAYAAAGAAADADAGAAADAAAGAAADAAAYAAAGAAAYDAAYAAADAAADVAAYAADAAYADGAMKIKILNYGISLLEKKCQSKN